MYPYSYTSIKQRLHISMLKRSKALILASEQLKRNPYRLNRILNLMDAASFYREEADHLRTVLFNSNR